ncbi:hypothetical protein QP096_07330 [Alloscardovia omnicolens]|uniref:hypothetical protein n=1 Tax=Alloscardovia omnicolens TaxID=419015 RepID=UPI0011AE6066|nr:hypothetical protein [Alloscardovia omnicolens]MDK6251801.1 hypothetical protein [Alloscardovia omnicolens]MDK6663270.1 hypothetical protein [Alloscardovia omnicolens]MDK7747239.1 hypothetical protein [Alloscardovia omnicolens]
MTNIDPIELRYFADIDLHDPFFDSLRATYEGFDAWYQRKAAMHQTAYVSISNSHVIAFLYLKDETGIDNTVIPPISGRRLKIGTFKVDFAHHSSLGKRLFAIAMQRFAQDEYAYTYVTLFDAPHTQGLRRMLEQYGFKQTGYKNKEQVWEKTRPASNQSMSNIYTSYPFIALNTSRKNIYLPIYPEFHSRMFSSRLATEKTVSIPDATMTNSIEKIYLTAMPFTAQLQYGDRILIYRTAPDKSSAYYSSVVSTVCSVVEVTHISSFTSYDEFYRYIKGRSVFTDDELQLFWANKRYPYILLFIENFSFSTPYPTRQRLLDNQLLDEHQRPNGQCISDDQLVQLIHLGGNGESFIIY